MVKFVEMDDTVTLQAQLASNESPVILINKFNVRPEETEALLAAWKADSEYFKSQPGFISTQMHRGIAGSCVFLNYAVWESVDHFRSAVGRPEFQSALRHYPSSAVASPHLFQKIAVEGICVAS